HRRAGYGAGNRFVMRVNFPIVVRVIVRWHDADGIDSKADGVFGELDGGERIRRADMHYHRHPAFDSLNDLLGNFLALIKLHDHTLAVGAKRKKAMHTRVQIKIDDRIGRFVIDGAVLLKGNGHWHQDTFYFSFARHSEPPFSVPSGLS